MTGKVAFLKSVMMLELQVSNGPQDEVTAKKLRSAGLQSNNGMPDMCCEQRLVNAFLTIGRQRCEKY